MKIMKKLFGKNNITSLQKKLKVKLGIVISFLMVSCSSLDVSGNLKGNDKKTSNEIGFDYVLNQHVKIKSKISQPYDYNSRIDKSLPEYGEFGLSFDF
jgi:hypothetical protein